MSRVEGRYTEERNHFSRFLFWSSKTSKKQEGYRKRPFCQFSVNFRGLKVGFGLPFRDSANRF